MSTAKGSFNGQAIPPVDATIALANEPAGGRSLQIKSNVADLSISGEWSFSSLVPALSEGLNQLAAYVSRKSGHRPEAVVTVPTSEFTSINADFSATLKDLTAINALLNGVTIDATGTIKGTITGTRQTISLAATGDFGHILVKSGNSELIRAAGTHLSVALNNITPGQIESLTQAQISIKSDSTVRFAGLSLTIPQGISIGLNNGVFSVHGVTALDNSVLVAVDGTVDARDPAGYRIALDTLIVSLAGGETWKNSLPVRALLTDNNRIEIDTLVLSRPNAETISVSGALDGSTMDSVVVEIETGSLKDLSPSRAGMGLPPR